MFWLLVILILSLLPVPEAGTGVNDKLSHVLAYGFLAAWFSLLVNSSRRLAGLVMFLFAFGLLIEALQSLTAYRQAELADLAANLTGIALAMPLYRLRIHRKLRHYLAA